MSTIYNELALSIIESYIWNLKDPSIRWRKDRFIQYSYSRWAAEELYEFVKEHDYMPPLDAVSMFIHKMDEYSCTYRKCSYIFSVAHDIAEDVFDILMAAM